MPSPQDLLYPEREFELSQHKLNRLVPHPNSYFMDVKCPNCQKISIAFSHASSVVSCSRCQTVLCTPTGGKVRFHEGCSYRRKPE